MDGVYQISSIGNLVWFSEAANSGFGVNYNAALTTDISQGRAVYMTYGTTKKKIAISSVPRDHRH